MSLEELDSHMFSNKNLSHLHDVSGWGIYFCVCEGKEGH